MKTVMKKIFSLLLVVALLVSAVPVVFADATPTCGNSEHAQYEVTPYTSDQNKAATCTNPGVQIWRCHTPAGHENPYGHTFSTEIPALGHTPGAAATCTTAQVCTVCWQVIEGSKGHTPGAAATCTEPQKCTVCQTTLNDATGHNYGTGTKCTVCGFCKNCSRTDCICCDVCKTTNGGHTATCKAGCNKLANCTSQWKYGHYDDCVSQHECSVCHKTGHIEKNCPTIVCSDCGYALANKVHAAGCIENCDLSRQCPNAGIQNATHKNGCEYGLCSDTNCTFERNHGGNHSYECQKTAGCIRANGHSGDCSKPADPNAVCSICNGAHDAADCPNDGDHDLKVFATMWTGDGREETVYLGTFYNLTTDTKIPEFMDANSARIDTWVAAVCAGYTWNDGKIYENKWSTDQMEWNDRMGYTDQEAFINVFRPSKDVVIFLHTGRTYVDYDWIKVEGKTTNDTLTLDEAKAIVKKYYNFSDLKMYDNDDWNEYVDGNDNIKPWPAVPISDYNVTKIHVLMSGYSAKNYSGSNSGYTADSTNPKTGDMIFAPAIVLGASVSALAVLFYLNKKRAY